MLAPGSPVIATRVRGERQGPNFFRVQVAPLAWCEGVVPDRPDAHPDEASHLVPDGFAHPPDLAVASLVDGHPQHPGSHHPHPCRRR